MPNEPPGTGHSALAERGFARTWREARIRRYTGCRRSPSPSGPYNALIHVAMRPYASHPVSPTVNVSAPGSGYVRSAAVRDGVPGHPAAGATAAQGDEAAGATSHYADQGRMCSVPVPSNRRPARQQPAAADPPRSAQPVSLQLRAMLAGEDQGGPGRNAVARTVHFQRHGWSHVLGLSWGFAGG